MESKDVQMLETLIVRLIDEAEAISGTSPQQVEKQQPTSYFSVVMLLHNLVHEGLIAEKLGKDTDQQLRNKLIKDLLDVIELLRGPSSTTAQSGITSSRSDARLSIARAQLGATTPKPAIVTPESDQLPSSVQPSPDIATSMLGAQHTAATTPAATTIHPTVTTQPRRRLEPITESTVPPVLHSTTGTGSRKILPGGQLLPLLTTTTTTTTTTTPGRRKSVRLNPQVVEIEVKAKSIPECTLASEYLNAALHRFGEERVSSVSKSVPVSSTSVVCEPTTTTTTTTTTTATTTTTTTPTTTTTAKSPHYRTKRDSASAGSMPSPWASTEKERMSYLDHSLDLYERRMYTQQQQDSDTSSTSSTSSRYVSPVVQVEGEYYDSDAAWILEQVHGTTQPSSSSNYVYNSTYSTERQVVGTERVADEAHTSPTTTATSTATAISPIDYIPSSTPSSASSAQHRSQAQRRLRELLHLDPLPHSSHSTATPTRQRPQRHSTGHK